MILEKNSNDQNVLPGMLQEAVDALPDMVYVVTTDGEMLFSNRSAREKLVLNPGSASGCCGVVHGCVGPPSWCPARSVAATGVPAVLETAGVGDGNRWYEMQVYPLFDTRPGETLLLHILKDRTEQRIALEALEKSEGSLAEAQRIARLGNWDWDIEKNTLHWSDEIYRIFGLELRQFGATYEAFLERVHEEDREAVAQAVNRALKGDEEYSIDHRIVRPDGTQAVVHEAALVYRDPSGRAVRMLGTVQDVTEQREAQEALFELAMRHKRIALQLSSLEDEERRKLATELHDRLGQELAMSRIGVARIRSKVSSDLELMAQRVLESLDRSIDEVRSLTRELRPPALHDSGLWEALEELSHSVESRFGVRVHLEGERIDSLVGPKRIDLFKVVRELVNNAVKHSEGSLVTVRLLDRGSEVVAIVEDDGKGLDRSSAEGSSTQGGFGIFSMRERVSAHAGSLRLENMAVGGVRATVKLPAGEDT